MNYPVHHRIARLQVHVRVVPQTSADWSRLRLAIVHDVRVINGRVRDTHGVDLRVRQDTPLENRREILDVRNVKQTADLGLLSHFVSLPVCLFGILPDLGLHRPSQLTEGGAADAPWIFSENREFAQSRIRECPCS